MITDQSNNASKSSNGHKEIELYFALGSDLHFDLFDKSLRQAQ